MAVSRIKTSSVLQGFPKSRSLLAGNAPFIPSSFESIATATGTGSSGTITFSSIPSTYKHLQIRFMIFTNTNDAALMQVNSDTGSNYTRHFLSGNGSTVSAVASTPSTSFYVDNLSQGTSSTLPDVSIIDLLDYSSTTKNKTIRCFSGIDKNGSGDVTLSSGVWMNTNSITSISIFLGANFTTTSVFSLYGIKGD